MRQSGRADNLRIVFILLIIIAALGAAGLTTTTLLAAFGGRSLQPHERELDKEEMKKHVLWGMIYSNPDDPRAWVPKLNGVGWTVNVRTRGQAMMMIVSAAATIVGSLLVAGYAIVNSAR